MPKPQDSGTWPPWRERLKTIDDPIAEERFTYRDSKGRRVTATVVIGHPRPVPDGNEDEWYCPLLIEGETIGIMPVLSLGPVGALVNAGSIVRQFLEENVFYPGVKRTAPGRSRKPSKKGTTQQPAKNRPRATRRKRKP